MLMWVFLCNLIFYVMKNHYHPTIFFSIRNLFVSSNTYSVFLNSLILWHLINPLYIYRLLLYKHQDFYFKTKTKTKNKIHLLNHLFLFWCFWNIFLFIKSKFATILCFSSILVLYTYIYLRKNEYTDLPFFIVIIIKGNQM